jgi:hypothetical protein
MELFFLYLSIPSVIIMVILELNDIRCELKNHNRHFEELNDLLRQYLKK